MIRKANYKIGIFAGSFDPVTFGHIDVLKRSLDIVDELHVAIGAQHSKSALFTPDERIELIKTATQSDNLHFTKFDGLLVDEAKRLNANFLIRSIRNSEDFEYEKTLAIMNHHLTGVETINLFANPQFSHISSSIVKQIAKMNGDVSKFVPTHVQNAIQNKNKSS